MQAVDGNIVRMRIVEALCKMRPSVVAEFNKRIVDRKGVEFSALAGDHGIPRCLSLDFNDGFTPVPSALWTIADTAKMDILYDAMASREVYSQFVLPRVTKTSGRRIRGIELEGPSGTP